MKADPRTNDNSMLDLAAGVRRMRRGYLLPPGKAFSIISCAYMYV